ncbi:hypothetical protein HPB52_014022 [Rhipicephalus sanguineus]|uniref:Uncharacterized protein n=1 Tax=Rhipicephalus sanguineus TaxID=34632 RepID=A0A9D4PXH7_RHISA|nr:hypothetical protein HPB52_014022 [Rhipicephalus sanguineus]
MREQSLDPYVDTPERDDSSSSASTSDDPDFDRPPSPQVGRLENVVWVADIDVNVNGEDAGIGSIHNGFCAPDESPGTECEAEVIPAGLRDALDNVSFDDYVDVDNSAVVCGTITDDDIIAQVTGGEEPVVEADKSDEQEEVPTRPSASQLLEAIGVARLFFSFEEGEEDAF